MSAVDILEKALEHDDPLVDHVDVGHLVVGLEHCDLR